ncbi:hypothetical protein WI372_09155 [Gemmatimonadota bacterium DH-20]|uniref:LamG domain-containing protein n=2 Tax=Gaopeijia maritima TaxID=3119007 RepID=A0ABU9E900_9BACT
MTFVLGIIASRLVGRRTAKTKTIAWGVVAEIELISRQVSDLVGVPVRLTIGEHEATSLTALRLAVESTGNEVVRNFSPVFRFNPECRVLHARPLTDLGEFHKHVSISPAGSSCRLTFDFLNPGEGIRLELLLSTYEPGSIDMDLAAPGVKFERLGRDDRSSRASRILASLTFGIAGVRVDATVRPLIEIAQELNSIRRYMRHVDRGNPGQPTMPQMPRVESLAALGPASTNQAYRAGEISSLALDDPHLVHEDEPDSPIAMSSQVLWRPQGVVALWVYVDSFGNGIRALENNRYLAAFSGNGGTRSELTNGQRAYVNVFSLSRGPRADSPPADARWRLWLASREGGNRMWHSPDTTALAPGWHHFAVTWDHDRPRLRLCIDGLAVVEADDYQEFWPSRTSETLLFGSWIAKRPIHFANAPIWRIRLESVFADDVWLGDECAQATPTARGVNLRYHPSPGAPEAR